MKRWVYGVAAVLALTGAWWVGRTGYNPTQVTQASTLGQAASPSASAAPSDEGNNKAAYLATFLDQLAANVGVDRAALDQAIRDSANQTLDQVVGNGGLTAQQADQLRQRIDQFPNNLETWDGPRGGFGGGGRHMGGMPWGGMGSTPWGGGAGGFSQFADNIQAVIDAVAARLNLSADELRTRLEDDQSLLAVAEAQGVSEADLRTAITDAVKTQLDAAVSAGQLTQTQADMIRQRVESLPLDQTGWGANRWAR